MSDRIDKTALSYWFPKIEAAGLPVPRTKIMAMPLKTQEQIWAAFDGEEGPNPGSLLAFSKEIAAAAEPFGFPFFLRTDHTSGKHSWEQTCFVAKAADIASHLYAIAEFSECCDMLGIPWSVWVVREFLPTIPLGTCPAYGNMPLCREFRFFVDDGWVRCGHPYWPMESLERGGADVSLYDKLSSLHDYETAFALAKKVARTIEGAWSVDILETAKGWYVTDMAEAHKSFHWEGCEVAETAAQS